MKNSFKKFYAFGKMTILHSSGEVKNITTQKLKQKRKKTLQHISELKEALKIIDNDIAKIHSKNPIKRMLIKRKLKRKPLLQSSHDPFNP